MKTRLFIATLQQIASWCLLLALMFLALALTAQAAQPATPLALQESHSIDRDQLMLGDLFANLDAASDKPLAVAPAPGKQVRYDAITLARIANAYRLPWRASSMVDQVVITRTAQTIEPAAITSQLHAALLAKGLSGEIELGFDQRLPTFLLPTDVVADVTLNNLTYDPTSRRFTVEVVAAAGSAARQRLALSGKVTTRVEIPVLARSLETGAVIAAGDLNWISVPAEKSASLLLDAGSVIGQQLRRNLAEGQPLRARDVMPPKLISRGQLVTMQVVTPAMALTAKGIAQQDAGSGDTIRLQNPQSKRIVLGRVRPDGSVVIDLALPGLAVADAATVTN